MIDRLAKKIEKLQLGIGVLFITIFFIAIVVQVFCRYAGITVSWTGEVSTYAFTWAVFMGAGVMCYENNHFAFTTVVDKLEGRKKQYLKLFISIVVLIFSLSALYYGSLITKKFWNYRWITLPAVKMGYTWLCVPIFGFTSSMYSINHICEHVAELRGKRSEKLEERVVR